jgi:hypothetical protein
MILVAGWKTVACTTSIHGAACGHVFWLGVGIENPCGGGSIPSRATKNIVHATPIHRDWRFRFRQLEYTVSRYRDTRSIPAKSYPKAFLCGIFLIRTAAHANRFSLGLLHSRSFGHSQ